MCSCMRQGRLVTTTGLKATAIVKHLGNFLPSHKHHLMRCGLFHSMDAVLKIRHRRRREERILPSQLIMASTFFLLYLLCFLRPAGSVSETFSSVNSEKLGDNVMEYNAKYRVTPLSSSNGIFRAIFCSTTPDAYALCIAMGSSEQAETWRIVWTANRNDPVRENATLTLGTDGNLHLSDVDGRVVWSTNTANKGVVGIELRNNGNLVLYEKLKKAVWQSFDHPTDTLLAGQSLNIGGVKKLVSRVSNEDGSEGPYSLSIEAGGLALYGSLLKPHWTLLFYKEGPRAITHTCQKPVRSVTFVSDVKAENGYRQMIKMSLANFTAPPEFRAPELCNLTSEETTTVLYCFNTPTLDPTLSFLRVEPDGDVKIYTISPHNKFNNWDITYKLFGCWRGVPQCDLQRKFGESGVVSRRCQCVKCAQADGFKGSRKCALPALADCKDASFNSSVDSYKLVGPEHFSSHHHHVNANPIGETETEECRRKCSHDCYNCAALLYLEPSFDCYHAPTVGTPNQLGNTTNLVFIEETQF